MVVQAAAVLVRPQVRNHGHLAMCKWGTETILNVTVPAHLSHTGVERKAEKGIDSCIADIVKALNEGGVLTTGSCCGHGKKDGSILLADGRELVIRRG